VTAILLSLAAACSWGVADFAGGLASRRLPALLVLLGQQALGVVLVGAVVLATGAALPDGETVALSLGAGLAGVVALGSFYRALAVGTMSIVAPVSAAGATLPVVWGLLSGERPSALQVVGLAVTVAGIVLASREAGGAADPAAARTSVLLALLAAAGFGTFFVLSDPAAEVSVPWLLLLARSIAVPVLLVAVALSRGFVRPDARGAGAIALVGVLDLGATALFAIAQTQGLLSIVPVIASLYPVTTVLLARGVLGERLQRVQAVGVVLAFAGVAFVAAG
jgi:drug/metabolite transporter (DMT)-like permease